MIRSSGVLLWLTLSPVERCCKHCNCYDTVQWCAFVNMVMVSNMFGGVYGNLLRKHPVVKHATFVQSNTAQHNTTQQNLCAF